MLKFSNIFHLVYYYLFVFKLKQNCLFCTYLDFFLMCKIFLNQEVEFILKIYGFLSPSLCYFTYHLFRPYLNLIHLSNFLNFDILTMLVFNFSHFFYNLLLKFNSALNLLLFSSKTFRAFCSSINIQWVVLLFLVNFFCFF